MISMASCNWQPPFGSVRWVIAGTDDRLELCASFGNLSTIAIATICLADSSRSPINVTDVTSATSSAERLGVRCSTWLRTT